VPDYRDDCPNNRSDELKNGVNLRGCPIDTDKDGVPDYNDQCDGTRLDVAVDPKGCAVVLTEKIVGGGGITFSNREEDLPEEVQAFLKTLVKRINNSFLIKIEVIGHTDSLGSHSYNQALSLARATRVSEYLILQGIPNDKIQALGAGETQPIASNRTEEGRAKNRRVEILITSIKRRD
jgi:OOP family OmpA-OmpF porin